MKATTKQPPKSSMENGFEQPSNYHQEYPHWICQECAESRGYKNRCSLSTYHEDTCGWCEQIKTVTQPRDYGYPKYSKNKCDKLCKDIC